MKIIDGLYFTIGMMLFNPLTGESKTPDQLNEGDRTTYDACMGAIALLKAQEPVSVQKKHMEMGGLQTWDWVCGNCGQTVLFSAKFCPWCGRAVKWE